jgi:hypothetical protein
MKLDLGRGSPLRIFLVSGIITVASLIGVTIGMGWEALLVSLILVAVELAFSFDNAIINAKVLEKMSPFWQQMFLTVGVVIAIFGMRVIFPLLIVMVTSGLDWHTVTDLALHHPEQYAEHLEAAHPSISAFGGSFLLMLALHFFMDDNRETVWLQKIERPLMRFGSWWLPAVLTLAVVIIFSLAPFNHHPADSLRAGIAGILLYLGINVFTAWIGRVAEKRTGNTIHQTGMVAFLSFIYLQVLDASFSFDGVIGAFAITNKILLIAIGLGIGAIWVRSLTVYMVRKGTLNHYQFLEHGAHYAVFVLAAAMLLSLWIDIPNLITGVLGIGLIGASILASRRAKREQMAA